MHTAAYIGVAFRGEFISDVASIPQRARQPVQLRDDERVTAPHRGERLAQSGADAVSACHSVVDVDM